VLFQPVGTGDSAESNDSVTRGPPYDVWSVGVLWLELITGIIADQRPFA
jgi:hypothetical protein